MSDRAAARYGLRARRVDHSGLGSGPRIAAGDMVQGLLAARSGVLPGILREVGMRNAVPMAEREPPPGGADWARRARVLQGQLVSRWAEVYG